MYNLLSIPNELLGASDFFRNVLAAITVKFRLLFHIKYLNFDLRYIPLFVTLVHFPNINLLDFLEARSGTSYESLFIFACTSPLPPVSDVPPPGLSRTTPDGVAHSPHFAPLRTKWHAIKFPFKQRGNDTNLFLTLAIDPDTPLSLLMYPVH
jgi:hypothetical protein